MSTTCTAAKPWLLNDDDIMGAVACMRARRDLVRDNPKLNFPLPIQPIAHKVKDIDTGKFEEIRVPLISYFVALNKIKVAYVLIHGMMHGEHHPSKQKVNARDLKAATPSGTQLEHFSAANGNENFLRFIFGDFKGDVNAMDAQNRTPIMFAAFMGNVESVKYLLDRKVVMHVDKTGKSALHYAARYSKTSHARAMEMSTLMVDSGLLTATARKGILTVVAIAKEHGNHELADYLEKANRRNCASQSNGRLQQQQSNNNPNPTTGIQKHTDQTNIGSSGTHPNYQQNLAISRGTIAAGKSGQAAAQAAARTFSNVASNAPGNQELYAAVAQVSVATQNAHSATNAAGAAVSHTQNVLVTALPVFAANPKSNEARQQSAEATQDAVAKVSRAAFAAGAAAAAAMKLYELATSIGGASIVIANDARKAVVNFSNEREHWKRVEAGMIQLFQQVMTSSLPRVVPHVLNAPPASRAATAQNNTKAPLSKFENYENGVYAPIPATDLADVLRRKDVVKTVAYNKKLLETMVVECQKYFDVEGDTLEYFGYLHPSDRFVLGFHVASAPTPADQVSAPKTMAVNFIDAGVLPDDENAVEELRSPPHRFECEGRPSLHCLNAGNETLFTLWVKETRGVQRRINARINQQTRGQTRLQYGKRMATVGLAHASSILKKGATEGVRKGWELTGPYIGAARDGATEGVRKGWELTGPYIGAAREGATGIIRKGVQRTIPYIDAAREGGVAAFTAAGAKAREAGVAAFTAAGAKAREGGVAAITAASDAFNRGAPIARDAIHYTIDAATGVLKSVAYHGSKTAFKIGTRAAMGAAQGVAAATKEMGADLYGAASNKAAGMFEAGKAAGLALTNRLSHYWRPAETNPATKGGGKGRKSAPRGARVPPTSQRQPRKQKETKATKTGAIKPLRSARTSGSKR